MHWQGNEAQDLEAEANRWVAMFAPLVLNNKPLTGTQAKKHLKIVQDLKTTGPALQARLRDDSLIDPELSTTLNSALAQLDSIEEELRQNLGRMSPGDADGIADLDVLQERLAERAARQEIGVGTALPAVYEASVSSGNRAAGVAMGVFGLGWTTFTLLHAVLMIGGMFKAFGWAAFFMLAFYSIFFLVGYGLLRGAYASFQDHKVRVEGNRLTLTSKFGRHVQTRTYELAPTSRVSVIKNSGNTGNQASFSIADKDGKQITFGFGVSDPAYRANIVKEMNAYLSQEQRNSL